MSVIAGGQVIAPSAGNLGTKNRVYASQGVPTDANIGLTVTAANGMLAENVATGFLYERQAGVWVRVDTV
jgi:hypothetical protein